MKTLMRVLLVVFAIVFLINIGILSYAGFSYYKNTNIVFRDFIMNIEYNNYLKDKSLDTDVADRISMLCDSYSDEVLAMQCVQKLVVHNFEYKLRSGDDDYFKSPDSTIEDGGVCRDYSVLYKYIFDKMKISNKITFVNNHVFNIVYFDLSDEYSYCIIDMNKYSCFR